MSYIPLPTNQNGSVIVANSPAQTDVVGTIITGNRNNSVIASFSDEGSSNLSSLINVSPTGTGTGSLTSGLALFSSGTGTSASITGQTYTSVKYNPQYEVYVTFSVAFTDPTSVNSSQFIGLWNVTTEGLYIGYNGTTFGSAVMTDGVQTFTNRASWNGDLLNGSATSKFTRAGVPEAINLNFLNLFRIRFSWWGSAPIIYEVMSPDGLWVVFHTIYQPNTTTTPSLRTPNLPVTLRVNKEVSDSTNLIMRSGSWAAGTTSPLAVDVVNFIERNWTSGTALNSVVEASALSAGCTTVSVFKNGTVSAGEVTFEVTPDGTHWFPATLTSLTDFPSAIFSTYPLSSSGFTVETFVGGYLKIRARLSTVITGAGSIDIIFRPSVAGVTRYAQVYQPTGTNLHTVIDSGTVTTAASSSTGNAPSSTSVGVTSATAVASNASRKGLILTNTSNRTISLGLNGATAVLNSGITLLPGGIWVMDSYTFTTGAITAIASAAASNLAIQEMQ